MKCRQMKEVENEGREERSHRIANPVCKTEMEMQGEKYRKGKQGRDSHLSRDPCRDAFLIAAASLDSGVYKEEHVSRAGIDWLRG